MADHFPAASVVLQLPAEKAEPAKRAKHEEVGVLTTTLRTTVNNPAYSDVRFVCKDGVKVHASRLLLVARSTVLRTLLTNGMAETKVSEIRLLDITSAAMLRVVEFLYTGSIVEHELTMLSSFETLHASRFLLLDKLEEYVMLLLAPALMEVTDFKLLAWCFSQYAELGARGKPTESGGMDSASLVENMASKLQGSGSSILNTLPIRAFNLYLDATKMQHVHDTGISFREYMRLRTILLWACFRISPDAEAVLRECLPDEKHLREGGFEAFERTTQPLATRVDISLLGSDWSKELAASIENLDSGWATVCFRHVHPQFLLKVLEPLGIIPLHVCVSALQYQALVPGNRKVMKWYPAAGEDTGVEIKENGSLLHVAQKLSAGELVFGSIPINYGLCEWEILVTAPGKGISIGICDPRSQFNRFLNNNQGRLSSNNTPGKIYSKGFGHVKDCIVRVQVDMNLRTCAFTIDGKELGVAWSDLPKEVYPAVLCTGRCKLYIKLVSDSDFV